VWRDGTSHFLFEPIEFLEKLAALIPRPAVNLLLYHGVLASRARWRSQVVRYGRPAPDAAALTREAHPAVPTHAWTWAALMHRTLDLAVLAWPRCGGRLCIVATIQDPAPRARLPRPPQRAPTSPAPPPARPHRRHPVTRGRPLTGAARSPAAPSRQGRGLPHSRRP